MDYSVLTFYCFTTVADPLQEAEKHRNFLATLDARSRIYISAEGINCQMSAKKDDCLLYVEWVKQHTPFAASRFQINEWHEHVFPRLSVKVRKQLVALDEQLSPEEGTGVHLSPAEWRNALDEGDHILIDVRNDYEWKVGHFQGALLPPLDEFRDFPTYARELKEQIDPKTTKVLMYCTGGIRCELYSTLMKQEGFEQVFQLDGGVINYGKQVGNDRWEGKLFVFDDRMVVPIAEGATTIGECCHCGAATDVYYNCADMDCNELFVSCAACANEFQGCCCRDCMSSPNVRPFVPAEHPKPFRRKHLLDPK